MANDRGHIPPEILIPLVLAACWLAAAIPISSSLPEDMALWGAGLAVAGSVAIFGGSILELVSGFTSGFVPTAGNVLIVPLAVVLAMTSEDPGRVLFWLGVPAAWNAVFVVIVIAQAIRQAARNRRTE